MTSGFILLGVAVALALLGMSGVGQTQGALPAATPEEAARQVLQAAYKGEYGQAARFFEGGPRTWESSPALVRQYIDRITDRGWAEAFKVRAQGTHGEEQLFQITTYADSEQTNPLRTMTWHFAPSGNGWVTRKVE